MVGSEVDVVDENPQGSYGLGSPDTPELGSPASSSPRIGSSDSVDDMHPSISPKGGAEALFIGDELETQIISAAALAQEINDVHRNRTHPSSTPGGTTVGTDDYQTCAEEEEPDDLILSCDSFPTDIEPESPFGKDVLTHTREPVSEDPVETVYHDSIMSASATKSTAPAAETHPDAAEKVYETAKNVWSWGKGVVVLSPFLGLAENVAGKVVSVATGSTLKDIDDGIQKGLGFVDEKYLNPAIEKLAAVLLGTVTKVSLVETP